MRFPTIHINGTNGGDLLEQNLAVLDALRTLQAAMLNAGPNGRDYYVQDDRATGEAIDEQRARLLTVYELVKDYDALVENISNQIDEREETKKRAIRRVIGAPV